MKAPRLEKIWLEEFDGTNALRADFDNDRHYRVEVQLPRDSDKVADALVELAIMIKRDPKLKPNVEVRGASDSECPSQLQS